jgi:hypothetical protein
MFRPGSGARVPDDPGDGQHPKLMPLFMSGPCGRFLHGNGTVPSLLVRARARIGAGHRADEAVCLRLDDVTAGRPDLRERVVAQVRLHEVADCGDEVLSVLPGTTSSSRVQNAA